MKISVLPDFNDARRDVNCVINYSTSRFGGGVLGVLELKPMGGGFDYGCSREVFAAKK